MSQLLGLFNYWVFVLLLMIGFYAVIARDNLIKKLLGLSIFQVAVFLLFISMGKVEGGTAPIIIGEEWSRVYSNPLPQVLILTAIVVGISTLALGLAIVVRIKEAYGRIEDIDSPASDIALGVEADAALQLEAALEAEAVSDPPEDPGP
jgi:multicomponent Na+:H+ antiporter subunit C